MSLSVAASGIVRRFVYIEVNNAVSCGVRDADSSGDNGAFSIADICGITDASVTVSVAVKMNSNADSSGENGCLITLILAA